MDKALERLEIILWGGLGLVGLAGAAWVAPGLDALSPPLIGVGLAITVAGLLLLAARHAAVRGYASVAQISIAATLFMLLACITGVMLGDFEPGFYIQAIELLRGVPAQFEPAATELLVTPQGSGIPQAAEPALLSDYSPIIRIMLLTSLIAGCMAALCLLIPVAGRSSGVGRYTAIAAAGFTVLFTLLGCLVAVGAWETPPGGEASLVLLAAAGLLFGCATRVATILTETEGPESPSVQQPASLAGWHPDPYGQAELRYWDGNNWTDQVH